MKQVVRNKTKLLFLWIPLSAFRTITNQNLIQNHIFGLQISGWSDILHCLPVIHFLIQKNNQFFFSNLEILSKIYPYALRAWLSCLCYCFLSFFFFQLLLNNSYQIGAIRDKTNFLAPVTFCLVFVAAYYSHQSVCLPSKILMFVLCTPASKGSISGLFKTLSFSVF